MAYSYIHEPDEIYRRSFKIVRQEARLNHLSGEMQTIATRLIHSCGMVDIVDDLDYSDLAGSLGVQAIAAGTAIFCDVEMVKAGIIQSRLPSGNELICTLNDPRVPKLAKRIGNTRSAAAVDLWDQLEGAVVVIGNAPTALFRLLERLDGGAGRPALVIAMPVGFVGAVESKQAVADHPAKLSYITVHGRRGGSAMASSVVNALAGEADS
ncbi:MAG: precorrin-8X methylmutase [Rhizobiaceae bacterium]